MLFDNTSQEEMRKYHVVKISRSENAHPLPLIEHSFLNTLYPPSTYLILVEVFKWLDHPALGTHLSHQVCVVVMRLDCTGKT